MENGPSTGRRVVVLSTHLDDAVLSVGAGLAAMVRRGLDVSVVTVLAGDPNGDAPAGPWDEETGFRTSGEATRARREEDRHACEALGVAPIWFPYNDEQYQRGGSDEEIGQRLLRVLAGADVVLVPGFPLVQQDHAWLAKLALSLELHNVGLYAEQPYLEGRGWPTWAGGGRNPDIAPPWYPLPATSEDRRTKRAAREAYRSQLVRIARSLGRDWPGLRERMDSVEWGMGGELVAWLSRAGHTWIPTSPPTWARTGAWAVARGWMWRSRRSVLPAVRLARSIQERQRRPPPVGRVRFGSLRRLEPISRDWGFERGRPVDRYYIEGFLADHGDDIRGRALEIVDDEYIRRFGAGVTRTDILHVAPGNSKATIIADLSVGDGIPSDAFDCVVLTQTVHLIYDVRRAISTLHRILKPGGVVLATMPGISQISRPDMDRWGDHWRFTSRSAKSLFAEVFGEDAVTVTTYGNVLAATALLYGLADRELTRHELDTWDRDYELVIGVRAVKPLEPGSAGAPAGRDPDPGT
ncbi:MAG: PIG-L family deacetylase [Actinomycetota bacterium]|nr:PIG-L family deacetylase [Actinomycetota bacterium]